MQKCRGLQRISIFMHVRASVSVCVFAYSLFICPPEQGVFSYLWPLKVQGWHAITKTALSITLTDRLKRGFNSYSSPWALHHRGRYPSTALLSPFIVSSCQSLGGLAKRPLLLLRSCYCVLAYPLVVGSRGTATTGRALSLNWMAAGALLARVSLHLPHTGALMVFLWRGMLAQSHSGTSRFCLSFPFTWVALSIPITACISMVSKQPSPPPIHHPFQPQSSRARRLRSPSLSFHRGFTRSLWKFTAWLGGTERKIKLLKAGSDHRWNPPKKRERKKNPDVNSGDTLPEEGAESWKSLSQCQA